MNINRSRPTPDAISLTLPKLKVETPDHVWVAESLTKASRSRWSTFTFHYKYDCFSASVSIPAAIAAQRAMRPCKYCVPNWNSKLSKPTLSDTIAGITRPSKKPKLTESIEELGSPSEPLSPCSLPALPQYSTVDIEYEGASVSTVDDAIPETPLSPVALTSEPNIYSTSYNVYPQSGYTSLTASASDHSDYGTPSSDDSVTEDLLSSPIHSTRWSNNSYSTLLTESFIGDVSEPSEHMLGFVFPTVASERYSQPTCLTDLIQMDLF